MCGVFFNKYFLEVAVLLWSFTCMPTITHGFGMPESGLPTQKLALIAQNITLVVTFPLSVPVEDPGDAAGSRDIPPNNHFYRKRNCLNWLFTKSAYYLRKTFAATTSNVLTCINVICSWKSQTFSTPICVCQPPPPLTGFWFPLLLCQKLYHHVGDHQLPEGAMLGPRGTEGWFQYSSAIQWCCTASP